MADALTIHSFGYWGWGNATSRLVEAVDAIEAARGFAPPWFADVRISRSVRAAGFRDRSFESLLGPARHRWIPGLGNESVLTHAGPPIRIANPAAAGELLDLALEAAREGRRVIFFCACEYPVLDGVECHRVEVGRLVCAEAVHRGLEARVVEWPGGEPISLELEIPARLRAAIARGQRHSIPVTDPERLHRLGGPPWGSIVDIPGGAPLRAVVGPLRFVSGAWLLPVLRAFAATDFGAAVPWATDFRARHGLEPARTSERR